MDVSVTNWAELFDVCLFGGKGSLGIGSALTKKSSKAGIEPKILARVVTASSPSFLNQLLSRIMFHVSYNLNLNKSRVLGLCHLDQTPAIGTVARKPVSGRCHTQYVNLK